MSRIGDTLFLAPDVPFANLDLSGERLPTQLQQRIAGFYLRPAMDLAIAKHAFAAGLLVVCGMDALGLLMTGASDSQARFKGLCRKIPDLACDGNDELFCEHFRNGLVHEARVKKGSEFSLGIDSVAVPDRGRLIVHPLLLAKSVNSLLTEYIKDVYLDPEAKNALRKKLKRTFRYELEH